MTTANKIKTSETLLALIREEYAHGRVFTFRGLQIELGHRNDIEPTSQWLNRVLREMEECGEVTRLGGKLIPTEYEGWAEYDKVEHEANDEYEKVVQQARAEYQRVVQPAVVEYEKIRQQAWAEYQQVVQEATTEYQRVRQAAEISYDVG